MAEWIGVWIAWASSKKLLLAAQYTCGNLGLKVRQPRKNYMFSCITHDSGLYGLLCGFPAAAPPQNLYGPKRESARAGVGGVFPMERACARERSGRCGRCGPVRPEAPEGQPVRRRCRWTVGRADRDPPRGASVGRRRWRSGGRAVPTAEGATPRRRRRVATGGADARRRVPPPRRRAVG